MNSILKLASTVTLNKSVVLMLIATSAMFFLLIDVHHPTITVYLSCFRSRYRLLARQGTC